VKRIIYWIITCLWYFTLYSCSNQQKETLGHRERHLLYTWQTRTHNLQAWFLSPNMVKGLQRGWNFI